MSRQHTEGAGSAGRILSAAEALGLACTPDDAAAMAPLLDRVELGLPARDEPIWPLDTAHAAGVRPDSTGWIWTDPSATNNTPGPLAGWRLAVKDIIAVAGHPRLCGSASRFDAPAEAADAPVVAALRAAGAHVVGSTKLHEFAFGTTGVNAVFGTPANPAAPGRVPGGSSCGAGAVVASGEADLSLGTDTGGSVRIPAALCGVVGFKPSHGAISTDGVWPLSPSLDHVGLLVARADRLVEPSRVLGLAGSASAPGSVRRLGVARSVTALCSPAVATAFGSSVEALRAAGFELVDVDWPTGEPAFAATTAIMFVEAAHVHAELLAVRGGAYGGDVRARLLAGAAIDLDTYLRARAAQRAIREQCLRTLRGGELDAVLTPTVPIEPPLLDAGADPAVAAQLVTFTRLADLTGLPAVTLPIPGTPLPVGLQLETVTDPEALAAALAIEAALR